MTKDAKQRAFQKYMHEFKQGKMRSSSGATVTNRKQAIAIVLSKLKKK